MTGRAFTPLPQPCPSSGDTRFVWQRVSSVVWCSPGYKLVGGDLAGIRVADAGSLLSQFDDGEYAKQIIDGDIHTFNQKAVGLETRDQAKTYAYAMIYGAGATRLGSIVGGGVKEGQRLKKRFLRLYQHSKNLPTRQCPKRTTMAT